MQLNEIRLNKTVKIKKLECDHSIRRRLLDLGLIENTKITPVLSSISRRPNCLFCTRKYYCT